MAGPLPRRQLNAARVIDKTLGAVSADFPRLFLFTYVLSTVPLFLASWALNALAAPLVVPIYRGSGAFPLQVTLLTINAMAGLAGWAGSGAVTFAALSHFKGERAGFAQCMLAGARFYLPLLAFAAILHLVVLLGFALLIVPGAFAATVMVAAGPAIVAERANLKNAFQRAAFLSRDNRWAILAVIVAYMLLNAAAGFASNSVSGAIVAGAGDDYSIGLIISVGVTVSVFSTIVQMFRTAGIAAVYHELRAIKDNPMEDELGQVFD
ncbi:MAG TPA: hypothetical protein VGO52_18130 [Hyphomonadaceae bacterium]|jgi:hypothetical protein|nr:hypothetical protein [Hyphomonadaceae bacterium]